MTHFSFEEKGKNIIIRPAQDALEIDVNVVPELRNYLTKLKINKRKCIYFHFENIQYIDSSGLGFLLHLVKDEHIKVYLTNVSEDVMEVFKATHVTQFFKFCSSKEREC